MLVMLLAVGCAPFAATSPVVPTKVGAPAHRLDGQWEGSGVTGEGKTIHLMFVLRQGRLVGVSYEFMGRDGVPCTNISYNLLAEDGPSLTGHALSATLGLDLDMQAFFENDSSASGNLNVDWQGRHNCTTQFQLRWQATRVEQVQAQPTRSLVDVGLCAKVNCPEVALQLIVFGLANGAVLALNAICVTVVYGAVRSLNLAHGDVFSLTSVLVTSILIGLGAKPDWPVLKLMGVLAASLAAALIFGVLLNIILEWIAFRPFRGGSRLASLIASLGISFILFQAAMIWRTHQGSWIPGEHRSVPGLPEVPTDGIPNLLPDFNLVKLLGVPLQVTFRFNDLLIILLAVFCALSTYAYLRFSKGGRSIRACTQNPELAQMIGIDLNGAIRRAFAIGGLLAGAAAFVFALYYGRPFGQNGAQSGLLAFTAAMLGGIGNPLGALVSALLLGIFSAFSDYLVNAEWTPVLLLALLVGVLFLRSGGLFGGEDAPDSLGDEELAGGQRMRSWRSLAWILAGLAIFPVLALLQVPGVAVLMRGLGIFILLAIGLNILLGMAGVLDLGYAAAFGIGAYSAAIVTNPWGLLGSSQPAHFEFLWVLLISVAVGSVFGLLKGWVTARLRNENLALATLALGLLVSRLALNLKPLTGGAAGISALPAPRVLGFTFTGVFPTYFLVFFFVVLAALASRRLIGGRIGRSWLAGSDDEVAARAIGIKVERSRLLAMVISSGLAGAAGALYAGSFAYVDPDILSFHWTVMLLAMVILGGPGSVSGAMLGALLIIGYDKLIIPQLSTLLSLFWPKDFFIGSVPDLRGTSFFNFGIVLYLTVLLRAGKRK